VASTPTPAVSPRTGIFGRLADHFAGGPWLHQAFRRLAFARAISSFGTWMQNVAAGFLLYALSGSAMLVGLLAAVALGPSIVFAPLGGALADRFCPRKLLIVFSYLEIVGPMLMAVAAATGHLSVAVIFVGVLLNQVFASMANPVFAIVSQHSVPADLRHAAVADLSVVYQLTVFAGAILGGTVVAVIGPAWAFGANAASYLVVGTIILMSPVLQAACDAARASGDGFILAGMREGLRIPLVRGVLLGAATFFVLVGPIQSLMPKIAAEHGENAMYLGLLLTGVAVGALIANPIVRSRVTDGPTAWRAIAVALIICGPATVLFGFSSLLWTDLLLLAVIGSTWETLFVSGSAAMQLDVPMHIKGRMIGVFYVAVTGCTAAGAVLMGWLFTDLGVDHSLWLLGGATFLMSLGLYAHWHRSMRPAGTS
jgi:MFS family permease